MIELLTLCGFKAPEIESQLPRVEKTFNRLGITAGDIERGKQRLHKYYDVELEGVRKAFRLCVLELVNSVLAREEGKTKIINGFMSPGVTIIGSAIVSKSKEVFSVHHSWAFQLVLGGIFDKIVPVLEAAEKKWLKAGVVAHCCNVKTILGLIALDLIPRPDLMITSGFLCETAPKTLDLLHELYDMPICCSDTCRDREFGEYSAATERTVDLASKSLRRLAERVQEVVGFEITDEMLREVLDARSRLDHAVGKLRDLIETSDPLPISATHETIWMCLNLLTLSIDSLPDAIDAINTLCEELQERVNKGLGVVEKGAPRILALLPAHHADPRLEHLARELGIAIVALDISFNVPYKGTSKDPYVDLAQDLQNSLATNLARRIPLIIEHCQRLNVDGVLDRFHVGCRTVAGGALIIKDAVEKELGIPVLLLEWENFDPRVYNHEQFKRRLEVFKTMLMKRAS
jgi:benzoyl-CoA reductase/2-hydroxyglutaryl-CoA dehydratase subunit BcrC/BadD/HgdB